MKNDNNLEQALRGFVEDGRELTVDDYEQLCAYIYVSLKGKYCVAQGTMATDLVAEAWTRFIETWDPDKSSACTWISSCAWSAAHRAYTVASKTPDQDSCVSDWASNMQPQCDPWAEKERKEELELVAQVADEYAAGLSEQDRILWTCVRTTGKLSREACKEAGMPVQSAYNRLKKLTFELRKELKRRLA